MTKNWKKITAEKKIRSKTTVYLSLGLHKEHPSYRRSLQLSKQTLQNMNFWYFFYFCVILALLDLDPLTRLNPDPIRIRIRNTAKAKKKLRNPIKNAKRIFEKKLAKGPVNSKHSMHISNKKHTRTRQQHGHRQQGNGDDPEISPVLTAVLRIRDLVPFWSPDLDPGSGICSFLDPGSQTHIFESLVTNFWVNSSSLKTIPFFPAFQK